MKLQLKEKEIKSAIEEVINFREIDFDTDSSFKNELNISIEIDYIKSNIARDYLTKIRSKLINLGYKVGYCSLSSYGEQGMYSSNSINTISFTVKY